MSRYRHRRTDVASKAFTNPLEPGEIAVNSANRQLAVGDVNSSTPGVPLNFLAIRIFDVRAQYVVNDYVIQAGVIYRANTTISPGAFTAGQWDYVSGSITSSPFLPLTGGTLTGALVVATSLSVTNAGSGSHVFNFSGTPGNYNAKYQLDATGMKIGHNSSARNLEFQTGSTTYLSISGTGVVAVAADPTTNLGVATKQYVDTKASVVSSVTAPSSPFDNALWWKSDVGQMFIRYNDGNSTQWVISSPQPDTSQFIQRTGDTMSGPLALPASAPTLPAHATNKAYVDGAVRVDVSQALTSAQQVQARQNVYAAPFDALAYNGMQVNGNMDVSQFNGATAVVGYGFVTDQWQIYPGGTVVTSTQQVTDAPPGYSYSVKVSVTTAKVTLASGDGASLFQNIEGYRVARLALGTANAQSLTVGFWCKTHRPGQYSCAIGNGANTRSCAVAFTQTTADTWQYQVITFPGDVTGTWTKDNSSGMGVSFCMAAHTAQLTAPGVWFAGASSGATGQINGVAATTDTFQITGLVVLPGIEAPSAARAPFIMRPYDQELLTCKRYFQILPGMAFSGQVTGPTSIFITAQYPVSMRAVPTTLTLLKTSYSASFEVLVGGNWATAAATSIAASVLFANSVSFTMSGFSGLTNGQVVSFNNNTSSIVSIDARL